MYFCIILHQDVKFCHYYGCEYFSTCNKDELTQEQNQKEENWKKLIC
jgi:hypothetical protein